MTLETCYDCGAVFDSSLKMYANVTYHEDWHAAQARELADLSQEITYLKDEVFELNSKLPEIS